MNQEPNQRYISRRERREQIDAVAGIVLLGAGTTGYPHRSLPITCLLAVPG